MIDKSINATDRIHPDKKGLFTYMDELRSKKYQIPTFQRDVVWDDLGVKMLWDSICKYYPLGSILVWKTDMKLQKHREIGGHVIDDSENLKDFNYILDGQQRTTSLLTSLYGGKIASKPDFNPELYVDLTVKSKDETDDSYKQRFLFWREIDNTTDKRNNQRRENYEKGLIVKLRDIKENFTTVQSGLMNYLNDNGHDFSQILDHPYNKQLTSLHATLQNYMLSFIEIQGIQVAEVCQIFERINQAGKPLDIFDIVVAKTFVPDDIEVGTDGFYLRDLIEDFKSEIKDNNSKFYTISDLTYLQIIATIVKNNIENSGVHNITDRYLNELTTEHIKTVWGNTQIAIKKAFDFLENYLHINIQLVPYRYFYLVLAVYFYKNENPDYTFLKQFFWYTSFHKMNLLSNTTQLNDTIAFIKQESPRFDTFQIDRNDLRTAKYSNIGRLSRAILALYANAKPKDWTEPDRDVIVSNFFFTTDKPNLHHIFPTKSEYIKTGNFDNDSLMNIAYITQATNLDILARDAIEYVKDYDSDDFRNKVLPTHLINEKIVNWSNSNNMPADALEIFIEDRIDAIIEKIVGKKNEQGDYVGGILSNLKCDVIDTRVDDTTLP